METVMPAGATGDAATGAGTTGATAVATGFGATAANWTVKVCLGPTPLGTVRICIAPDVGCATWILREREKVGPRMK